MLWMEGESESLRGKSDGEGERLAHQACLGPRDRGWSCGQL